MVQVFMATKITLEKLAEMVAEGFIDIGERMATKNDLERLREELLANLRLVDARVSSVSHRLVRMSDYVALEKRVETLEAQIKALLRKK